ncbi:MAG: antibiotic biosynthesis monooxygenase [Pseudomonadota bacterium]
MYVVIVDFDIHPAHWKAFRPLMAAQAANSLEKEPGCRVFTVQEDLENPTSDLPLRSL